jgi:hypothetical protein
MSISSRVVSGAALLVALLIAGLIIGSLVNLVTHAPRAAEAGAGPAATSAATDVLIGQADGEIVRGTASQAPSGDSITAGEPATPAPTATPTPTPEATDAQSGNDGQQGSDGFSAEVVVCQSVKGSHCSGQTDEISTRVRTIWIMVSFKNAASGDRIGMTLSGPGGTRDGGRYAVKGGDGRAWAEISGRLSRGDYTVTATRNGAVVAESTLHVR